MNELALIQARERSYGRGPDPELVKLTNANRKFIENYHEAVQLGRALLDRFDQIEEARADLLEFGIHVAVELEAPIQAAAVRLRELTRDPMQPPEWIR